MLFTYCMILISLNLTFSNEKSKPIVEFLNKKKWVWSRIRKGKRNTSSNHLGISVVSRINSKRERTKPLQRGICCCLFWSLLCCFLRSKLSGIFYDFVGVFFFVSACGSFSLYSRECWNMLNTRHICVMNFVQFARDHVKFMLKHIISYQIICETYAERQVHRLQRKSYERFFMIGTTYYLSNLIRNDKMWPNFMFNGNCTHDHHLRRKGRPTGCCYEHLLMQFKIRKTKWSLKQCIIMSKLPSKKNI